MSRKVRLLSLCALLALVPAVHAHSVATLDVRAAEGTGTNEVQGDLLAFFSGTQADAAPAPGTLRLEAQRLRVETDREERTSVAGFSPLPSSPTTSSVEYGGVVAEAVSPGRDTYFFLAAVPGAAPPTVEVVSTRVHLQASDGTPAEAQRFVISDRPPVAVGTLGGHAAAFAPGARVTVAGDFLLVLWDWDLRVGPGAGIDHPSGREELNDVGGIVKDVRLRQLYVFATGARLEFETDRPEGLRLLLDARSWQAEGEVRFEQPDGRLRVGEGTVDVEAPELVLEGAFGMVLGRPSGGQLPVVVRGDGEATALLQGDLYTIAQPGGWFWRIAAAVCAAVVLLAGGLLVRRDLARRRFYAVEAAMDAGRFQDVLRLGPRLLGGRHGGIVALALGTVHLRQERPGEALSCLEQPRRWAQDLLGSRAFLAAVGHAALGDVRRARQELDQSLRLDPGLGEEARRHPALRRFLPEPSDRDVV